MAASDEDLLLSLFESHIVSEDRQATKIVTTKEFGRVVVATRDFPTIGDVIVRERPLLVWDNRDHGFACYLDAFLSASPEAQSLILDMHTPPTDSKYMANLRSTAVALCRQLSNYNAQLGVDKVVQLIGVSNINAHEYYGRPAEAFHEVESTEARISSGKSALFAYGSKIAHSCCPNATYTSKTADGCLEYKVLAPIQEGDMITFAYIDNNPSVPTHLRRQELMDTKVFFCECLLCTGMDYARLHPCPTGACPGKVSCVQPTENSNPQWSCTECGAVSDDIVRQLKQNELQIQNKLSTLLMKARMSLSSVHPSIATALVEEATRVLSNTHFLTLQVKSECSRLCASHAQGVSGAVQMGLLRADSPTPYGSLVSLRLQSATFNLEFVRGCECVAARCTLGPTCPSYKGNVDDFHVPVYTCNVNVFHSLMDLKDVPDSRWPEGSVSLLKRYVLLCYVQFGLEDQDVQEMEAKLATMSETKKKATLAAAGRGGRTNKKKKGKKGRGKKK